MIEAYSESVNVNSGSAIPFNNVTIQKGCTAILSAPATIQFNKMGVYMVSFNTSAIAEEAGVIEIEMAKNGVVQPQASSSATAANTTSIYPSSFTTLVQVSENNTPCCCTSPTTIQILNNGVAAVHSANIVVTKIC